MWMYCEVAGRVELPLDTTEVGLGQWQIVLDGVGQQPHE